ncbi:hypothetical protein E3O42_09600 [Cryobacterium adonitolivorans]|uniref:Restriction endonuclease n=1 Tax=Cryobacterium adonitolivorans TaxID=1259189 RepID=A0A4R8W6A9_9MICO|nr:PaeR7I family type II restriction endonuclease [Cryobacterium adonitolivorans]TFC01619.1 hypothetical protein E3O42_09600 [Cryobacterium adonitolivorans]
MEQSEAVLELFDRFWREKDEAVERHRIAGREGGAQARDARHMVRLAGFVRQMFISAGLADDEVHVDRAIPGYYRRSKNWDVVAMHKGHLVGVVELKSQVGSEGNNGNNRIEEALGNSFDARAAQELNHSFGALPVWNAFCVVFGSDPSLSRPVRTRGTPLFRTDPIFDGMTYGDQWAIAVERFVLTGAYSAGWMAVTWVDQEGFVNYDEPVPAATAETLLIQIEARVRFAKRALARE